MTQRAEDRELDLMHRESQAFRWLVENRHVRLTLTEFTSGDVWKVFDSLDGTLVSRAYSALEAVENAMKEEQ